MAVIFLQIFMWIAVALTIALLIPAVYQVAKTKNTTSISHLMYIFYPICSASWIVYAILMIFENVPISEIIGIAVSECISMLLAIYILFIKLQNMKKAKNLHMTEAQWYRAYIKRKEWEKHLKKMGIKNPSDLKDNQEQREELTKILWNLSLKYPDIVEHRITHAKHYANSLNREIKSFKHKFDHFRNVSTNADLAQCLHLVYLDIYKDTLKSETSTNL